MKQKKIDIAYQETRGGTWRNKRRGQRIYQQNTAASTASCNKAVAATAENILNLDHYFLESRVSVVSYLGKNISSNHHCSVLEYGRREKIWYGINTSARMRVGQ